MWLPQNGVAGRDSNAGARTAGAGMRSDRLGTDFGGGEPNPLLDYLTASMNSVGVPQCLTVAVLSAFGAPEVREPETLRGPQRPCQQPAGTSSVA